MKILITGGRSATALKLLKAFTSDQIVLADYGEVPTFSSAAYQFISLGEKNEDVLAHSLLNHCLDEQVDAILPLHQFELLPLAKAAILFNEFDIAVLLPELSILDTYLHPIKGNNWLMLNNGKLIFSTVETEDMLLSHKMEHLSGAYYVDPFAVTRQLSLITI